MTSVVVALVLAEALVRSFYAVRQRDPRQLVAWGMAIRPRNAIIAIPPEGSVTVKEDACQAKPIRVTVDRFGVRGGDDTAHAPANTRRIVTLGGSSTFGMNSSDDATWPARLETLLPNTKVYNLARPAQHLGQLVDEFDEIARRFHPDLVIYYGGYFEGNHVHRGIGQWHADHPVLNALYYRSMLYTYAVEKVHFTIETSDASITPDTAGYVRELNRLIESARRHGASTLLVLEATQIPRIPTIGHASGSMTEHVRALIDAAPPKYGFIGRSRMVQTQVLQEFAKSVGAAQRIAVVDPRPDLEAAVDRPHAKVLCDDVHPGDEGNAIIAANIARALAVEEPAR